MTVSIDKIEDRAYKLTELADLTGISYDDLHGEVTRGAIKHFRLGNRIWIPYEEVKRIISPVDAIDTDQMSINEALAPERWRAIQEETESHISKKWKTLFRSHPITVFESKWGNGWTFVCDGIQPRIETYDGKKRRAFYDTREEAMRKSLEFAIRIGVGQ